MTVHVGAGGVHSRCEVGGGRGCFGGVRVQSGSPDSAFVTQKRSDPVPCVSLAQHGLAIWEKTEDSVGISGILWIHRPRRSRRQTNTVVVFYEIKITCFWVDVVVLTYINWT